ncbi:22916_t:CDS:2 [Entrophospora sp. SA101]|nr:13232_t:CDS:2 [Entrophospora sp. SA101]CAJ0759265.1 22916_t:CDS:2 [Entrophospora sp. SA101]CAJ0842762.1 721_t:CDS:2 [Entrophospora sp. SA101]CAJ0872279.1 17137_t:CDS:2 [Entrophospora sp. SA101]
MCQLYYGTNDLSLAKFPFFDCVSMELHSSKSQYVCAYLMVAANLFVNKFEIHLEKNISGLNGHGPVDFGLVIAKTNKIIGVTKVKAKDFMQGIAQNLVQCESALSDDSKVFGIITDSQKWFFLECSSGNEGKTQFKLSKPVVDVYGDEDMESRVRKVIGYIAWLLQEALKSEGLKDTFLSVNTKIQEVDHISSTT